MTATKTATSQIQTKALPIGKRMLALEPRYVFDAAIGSVLHHVGEVHSDGDGLVSATENIGDAIVAAARQLASHTSAIESATSATSSNFLAELLSHSALFDTSTGSVTHPVREVPVDGGDHLTALEVLVAAARQMETHANDDGSDVSDTGNAFLAYLLSHNAVAIDTYVEMHNLAPFNGEIAFIDNRLADLGQLVAAVPDGVRIVLIDGSGDGVQQMADALQGRSGVTGIHIVSHGEAGDVTLGTAHLNAETMAGVHQAALAEIGTHLSADADILVYGCNFAAGDAGAAAVAMLADLTGADVAASEDATGSADLGGDWVLESTNGPVDVSTIAASNYAGTLADTNTTAWSIAGNSATTTTQGITTTVTFTPNSSNAAFGTIANGTFNTIPTFTNAADGDPSLSFVFTWDNTPEPATGVPQPNAVTDTGTGTITITFSEPVTNPVINLDRLGGYGQYTLSDAFGNIIQQDTRSNGALWTLTTPGATLTELTGTSHFDVTSTTIQRTPNEVMANTGLSGESGTNSSTNTAAGSVQVNGTFTTITFQLSGVGVEGGGQDGIEIGFILDAAPTAQNDSFTVNSNSTLTGNLFANNGSGADSDPTGDALTITAVNGTAVTVNTPIVLANGTLTITNAATGAFTFVPNAGFTGLQTFDYTIADPNGGTDTASVGISVLNSAPDAIDDPSLGGGGSEVVTAADLTTGLSGGTVTVVDATNTMTFSVVSGPDPLQNDGPFGVGFARNNGATDNTLELAFTSGVDSVDIGFGFLNNDVQLANSDGIEQLANFRVFDTAGNDITSQVTFSLADNSTQGGLTFEATSSLNGQPNSLVPQGPQFAGDTGSWGQNTNGILTITSNGPAIGSIQFTHQNITDTRDGLNQPFGVVLESVSYTNAVTGTGPYVTDEATVLSVPVANGILGNDTDPENDPLTVIEINGNSAAIGSPVVIASGAIVTLRPDGSFDYDPNHIFDYLDVGQSTTDTFQYTISDGKGGTDTATVTVTINGLANNAPPALVDPDPTAGTPSIDPLDPNSLLVPATDNVPLALPLGPYYSDPNGDPLTITIDPATLPSWLTYDPVTQTLSGTPPADNTGDVVIPVTVDDGHGGVIATTITIQPVNPAPDAVDDATTTAYGTPVVVDLLANDTDADGDPLTVTGATLIDPSQGTLVNAGGVWTFTPATGFSGTAMISYTIADQDGATDTAIHTVTVGNAPPALVDPDPAPGTPSIDPLDTNNLLVPATDNVPLALPLGPYYSDPNGDPLTITIDPATLPSWLTYDPVTQTLSGTPPADNTGDVVIPVTVDDGHGGVIATTITIQPVNPAPDAVDDATTTAYGTPVVVDLLANDTDADGDPLTVTGATLIDPSQGTLVNAGGVWTFTPATGFSGTATISYTIADQDGATDTATHAVTVDRPPAPVAVNDIDTVPYGSTLTDTVAGNDQFAPGSTFAVLAQPSIGTLVFDADGTYSYVPESGFVGTEMFVYQVIDPTGQTSVAIEVIRIMPPPIVAVSDVYVTPFDTALAGNAAANDTAAAGSTFFAITAPMHGTLAMNADGTYVYTPQPGFHGVDMFAYAVTDPTGQTRFATDTITVSPPPGPTAVDDAYSTGYRTPLTGNAAGGDTYGAGSTFEATTQPTHGTLVFNPDGTFSYTPADGFAGTDTFTYRVTDANGNTATATETVTVAAPSLDAVDDAYSGVYGMPVNGDAAHADTFAPGSTFALASDPAHGTVTMNADGSYTYTPAAGFAGTDTFTYRVTDPTGQMVTATETIIITPPELVAVDDHYTTAFNAAVHGNAATSDTFAPGSTFAVATPPSVGTVSMNDDGTFIYTPPSNFAGTVTFTYQVTDPTGQIVTATETIVVSRPQLIAVNDSYSTPYNTPLSGNAALGDTYAPGSVFAAVTSPAHGSITMNANGTYSYQPDSGFSGTDTFTYSITDPTGQVVTAVETITVSARPPVHRCLTTFGHLNVRR